MKSFAEKVYLSMVPPTEEDARSCQLRVCEALAGCGYPGARLPLRTLQRLYDVCLAGEYRITATLVHCGGDWIVTSVEPGDARGMLCGLAVDYGSTTIVMQLVDLNTGAVMAQASETNGQRQYGTDILTRITCVLGDPARADDLQAATAETFNRLLRRLSAETGVTAQDCPVMVVSGNTSMIHFLLKLNAWTVFASPFAPVTTCPDWLRGDELGFDFPGMVFLMPSASNYIGGDIVSGLLTIDLQKKEEIGLFFDIGTNGELVIGNREWLLAGAGAAGPALEGYISRYGVRAQPGAIDTVTIRGAELSATTIGNRPPIGICGSGIIDLLAQMRLNGWINIAGELNPDASPRIQWMEEASEYAAVYADADESGLGTPLYFTQTDIRQYLETKAAAYTMVDCLLESAGCRIEDIAHCYLSGAFSAHSNLESAITIGMFPDLPRERFTCIPNSSLDGARTLLLNRDRLEDVRFLTEHLYCVQFASVPDFIVRMHAAKFIPHTDMRRFPSIAAQLP